MNQTTASHETTKAQGSSDNGPSIDGTPTEENAIIEKELFEFEAVEPLLIEPSYELNWGDFLVPYPDQVPRALLHRPFLFDSGTFVPDQTKVFVNSPNEWLTKYTTYLAPFKYWRADFEISVFIRASNSIYGAALINWHYGNAYHGQTTTIGANNIRVQSSSNALIADLASAEANVITIPYLISKDMQEGEIVVEGSTRFNAFYVTILSLNSLNADETPSVGVEMWMCAKNIQLGGYVEPQSIYAGKGNGGLGGLLNNLSAPTSLNLANPLVAVAMTGAHILASAVFGSPDLTVEDVHDVPESSADAGSSGIKILPYGTCNTIGPNLEIPCLRECERAAPNMAALGMNDDYLLKDLCSLPVIQDIFTFNDANLKREYSLCIAKLRTDIVHGTTTSGYLNNGGIGGWCAEIGKHFRYWRGDVRYTFIFPSSPLIAARFHISVNYGDAETTAQDGETHIPVHDVLVKGYTTVDIVVPYHSKYPVLKTMPDTLDVTTELGLIMGKVQVHMVQSPTAFSTGGSTNIDMITLVSISNIQLFSIQTEYIWKQVTGQSIRAMHQGPAEFSFGNGTSLPAGMLPEITKLSHLLSRFSLRRSKTTGTKVVDATTILRADLSYQFHAEADKVTSMSTNFAFYSGGLVVKVFGAEATTTASKFRWIAMSYNGSSFANSPIEYKIDPCNGAHYIDLGRNPAVEYRIPYLSTVRIAPTSNQRGVDPYVVNTNLLDADIDHILVKADTDFRFFHLNRLSGVSPRQAEAPP